MRKLFIPYILLFCLPLTYAAKSQILPFRTYSIERGLSESVVNDIVQDPKGYIWIATEFGLNRLDGVVMENFFEEDGLRHNKLNALFVDREGLLWVGSDAGISVLDEDTLITPEPLMPLNGLDVTEIFQDQAGDYWFATNGDGVWLLDRNKQLTQYRRTNGLADNDVRDILEDANGALWFATRGGLTQLKGGNFRNFDTQHGLPDEIIRELFLDRSGKLWVATRSGLVQFEAESPMVYTEQDGLVNDRIRAIAEDYEGNLWIATENGASYFDGTGFRNFSVENGLPNEYLNTVYSDREGNIWFGSFGGGASYFQGFIFESFTVDQGLPNNVVTSVAETGDGAIWISTYGSGISRLKDGRFRTYSEEDGLVDNKVYTLHVDRDGTLWIGTRWGLSVLRDGRFVNYSHRELPARKIRTIYEEREGDRLWFGTIDSGVMIKEGEAFQVLNEDDGLPSKTVMDITQDTTGTIWLATYGGISQFNDGVFTNRTVEDGLPNNGVLDLEMSRDGSLWIATFGGFSRYRDGSFLNFGPDEGLVNEVCYFIREGPDGYLWIGTNKGLVRFDPGSAITNGRINESVQEAFRTYTTDQGLVANELNAGAVFIDSGRRLWVGSVGGVSRKNLLLAEPGDQPPSVYLDQVQLYERPLHRSPDLMLENDQNYLSFHFTGLDYRGPEQITYLYRLRGADQTWQRTRQRTIRYAALPAGAYRFEVKARGFSGMESSSARPFSFTILPPFWLRWWFILLVGIALTGIIYLFYRYFQLNQMVELERLRVQIASDLHDDVGASLTEIALQTDFLLASEPEHELSDTLSSIGTQSRRIVSSLDDIVWTIDSRNDTLGDLGDRMQDYANRVLGNSPIRVQFHFDIPDTSAELPVEERENLYLVFKEAINNVAKHSNASKVDINLFYRQGNFELTVSDNGQVDPGAGRKSGQGQQNMKMRARRIGAEIDISITNGYQVTVYK